MTSFVKPLVTSLLPFSLAWGAIAMPANANGTWAEEEETAPLRPRCQLQVDDDGDSIVLEGVVFASKPASGSYQIRVSQVSAGGSSNIAQSGNFIVESGSTASLGTVSLSNRVSRYFAKLTVQWDDGAADCIAEAPKRRKVKLFDEKSPLPDDEPFASTDPLDQAEPK
ncbi:MAG: curli-like amyloid fiber formation chaperone CsgH [Methyloceanibacter sp.]|uniref:curli-like amyloid fiber formation chaperone CsgH n=1 Tax=Methyloceanibacter sp. TaxID=1965321 RepID=UPI003D9B01F5